MLVRLYQEFSPLHVTNSPVLVLSFLHETLMGHKSLVEVKGAIEVKGYFFSDFSGYKDLSLQRLAFLMEMTMRVFGKIEFH